MTRTSELKKYLRLHHLPTIWCPGCGNGQVVRSLLGAFESEQINQDNTVIVSGIGCAARAPGYLDFNTLHTTHGRALAFATGIKLANPGYR
jgi:2-oxoglutarate/2-oxoacid ferredoxin oxidoreductase subunit beta